MLMNSRIGLVSRLAEWLGSLWGTLRMGFSLPLAEATGSQDEPVDSKQEFHGWLESIRFSCSTAEAKKRIKAREQARKPIKPDLPQDDF